MSQTNQAVDLKDLKLFIKKVLEDLQRKTGDLAVNKSMTSEAI